jgi:hypothetical protein
VLLWCSQAVTAAVWWCYSQAEAQCSLLPWLVVLCRPPEVGLSCQLQPYRVHLGRFLQPRTLHLLL